MNRFTKILSGLFRARHGGRPKRRHSFIPTLEMLEDRQVPAILVTSTADSGAGSLRQAILDANNTAGRDTIQFVIPATDVNHRYYMDDDVAGQVSLANVATTSASDDSTIPDIDPDWRHSWWSIQPNSQLPDITAAVVIDGYSQSGAAQATAAAQAVLTIELDGSRSSEFGGYGGDGITIRAPGCTVQGLVIRSFSIDGITILDSGATGNVVAGNYIGTDVAGAAALANGRSGVRIESADNTVGGTVVSARNVISDNGIGVTIEGSGATENVVAGNYIGTNAAGTADLGNYCGVYIASTNNTVGGTAAGARNVISGNAGSGIIIEDIGSSGNVVAGNYIGTNATGTAALRNGAADGGAGAVIIASTNNTVGGTAAGARNVISGNATDGIIIDDIGSSGNVVAGNYIGTDAAGAAAVANGGSGVRIESAGNTVGGTSAGARNVISGNGATGVATEGSGASGNSVQGNYIGTDATGTAALGNGYHGVTIGSSNNTVGGTAAGARNVISGNDNVGVSIRDAGASGNLVQGNYIGTNAAGTAALGNVYDGVDIDDAPNNTVGATAAGARNVISGNGAYGVSIAGSASGNVVQGNYIGTNATGTAALGNVYDGVSIRSSNNTVGGTAAGARNVISGNASDGVSISFYATGNVVAGNYIGTNAAGTAALRNGTGVTIEIGSVNNTIGGAAAGVRNVISGNANDGVTIEAGFGLPGNVVAGNYIGTNAAGTAALGNGRGVSIEFHSGNNTIGGTVAAARNVISGNVTDGVAINGSSASGNMLVGNYIGTNPAGTAALRNGRHGVVITGAPDTIVGGIGAGRRNVISGNALDGVRIVDAGATGTYVQGNYIGINAAGTATVRNGHSGVIITGASNNIVGGGIAGLRNVISGNGFYGVVIDTSSGNVVQGNYIGTNAAGAAALGNDFGGVSIASANNTVGGTIAGARNIISGNHGSGVAISNSAATGNVVQGNYVGTDATGAAKLGNTSSGVSVTASASNNAIGGTATGTGNLIAYNGSDGVSVTGGPGNAVLSNRVFANAGLGIDLADDGVTPNIEGDADSGPNNLQNFPVLTAAYNGNGNFIIQGRLNSTPNTSFRLEFFADAAADPSGYGEGERLLGNATVTTDASGDVAFALTLSTTVSVGQFVTATATRLESPSAARDTSEFSQVVVVPGSIAGRTFHDRNANGVQNGGEPGLANWTIYLDANGDGQLNEGETSTLSNSAGNYAFANPPLGINVVREILLPLWLQSTPGLAANEAHKVTLAAGQALSGLDFGNFQFVSITGRVFHDLNANGSQTGTEPGLGNWIVYLDANNNGQFNSGVDPSTTTDSRGDYRLDQLLPGSFVVREVLPAGWQQSTPSGGSYTVVLSSGQTAARRNFGNYQPVTISGTVFHDYDTDGVRGRIEPGLSAWNVYLDANNNTRLDASETVVHTDAAGRYFFAGLRPGTHIIREELQSGWRQTAPATGSFTVTLTSGQSATDREFGNTPRDPMLIIILSQTTVSEGAGRGAVTATVIRSGVPTTAAFNVSLSSSDTTEAQTPTTVTIPAGQSEATFLIDAIDDFFMDGTQSVLLRAFASGFADGQATLLVTDDDA